MKVSLNQITQYIDFELPPVEELVKRINEQLGGVEEVIDVGAKYKTAVIVRIVTAEQHPNADRLRVCKIDDGGKVSDVPRDDNGYVQVVCGAPNAEAGKLVVWLPPRATVPSSFDDKEPFVLDARELRGILSQGMLAAADELAIGSDHDGILEVNPDEWKPTDITIEPGASFAKVYGLDDTIIDIENKMFTHRPDLFGQLGVAREIAGIFGHKFVSPSWYLDTPTFEHAEGLELDVFNEAPEKVSRFTAVALKNIEIKPSPLWLQCALVAMGSKPINNIVDATNYVMLLTAQPTHAYDYDKIRGHKIGARMAKAGEKVTLLNDKTYELTEDDIVIADSEGPIGLGGIMGGGDSEVDAETKNIILEVATFDMYAVRKSSMRHGVFTDALTRFNKGQSPRQNDHIMNLLMMSIKDVSSADQASDVADLGSPKWPEPVQVTDKFINERLGLTFKNSDIITLLANVELSVDSPEDHDTYLEIMPPFWRTDIELPEDIVEEVGRLYGFDKLPRELPRRSVRSAPENQLITTKQQIRRVLSRAGANEILTYSFVHGDLMRKCHQDPAHAFKLSNALSPDLQYYRLSLMPSLLARVHGNIKAGYDEFALFEIGKAHSKGQLNDEGLPREDELTACVVAAKDASQKSGAAYFAIKRYLTDLLGDTIRFETVPEAAQEFDSTKPYDLSRSAFIYNGEVFLGVVGEFKSDVRKALKLPDYVAGFEIDTAKLLGLTDATSYQPLSRFPSVSQDISLRVARDVAYANIMDAARQASQSSVAITTTLEPLDIYAVDDDDRKTITLRVTATSMTQTLRDADIAPLMEAIANAASQQFAAERM